MKLTFLAGGAMLLLAHTASADTALSAEHRLLSSIQQGQGFLTSFEVTVTNSGTENLSAITLIPADATLHVSETDQNGLAVGALLAGAQLNTLWTLVTPTPIGDYIDNATVYFGAEALDATGQARSFPVSSLEQVAP